MEREGAGKVGEGVEENINYLPAISKALLAWDAVMDQTQTRRIPD